MKNSITKMKNTLDSLNSRLQETENGSVTGEQSNGANQAE